MSNKAKFIVFILLIVAFGAGFGLGNKNTSSSAKIERSTRNNQADFNLFWNVWDKVEEKTIAKTDPQQMVYGAIKGMVASLKDPFSTFLDPEESKKFLDDISGEFEGIGAELAIKDEKLTVIAPLEGTPAKKAGLLPKDIILAIDGEDTALLSIDESISKIRGPKGTSVRLTVQRGQSESFDLTITRSVIKIDSVKSEIRDDGIGIIKIAQFSADSTSAVKNALLDMKKASVKGIVLDLRNNPGGLFTSSIDIASFFIKDGIIVIEEGRNGQEEFRATQKALLPNTSLKVLVNEGSASAAEIVAGALQDHQRGQIIGQKTFGKGTVQDYIEFKDKSSLKITIAKWLTPNKKEIDKKGIEPDLEVLNSRDSEQDAQLEKAISLVKEES